MRALRLCSTLCLTTGNPLSHSAVPPPKAEPAQATPQLQPPSIQTTQLTQASV